MTSISDHRQLWRSPFRLPGVRIFQLVSIHVYASAQWLHGKTLVNRYLIHSYDPRKGRSTSRVFCNGHSNSISIIDAWYARHGHLEQHT